MFYLGKWIGWQQSYKTPDRILDLETGGASPESETDPYAQYAYRLEVRPVVKKVEDPNNPANSITVLKDGSWEFTVLIYRNYREYGTAKLITDGAGWYDPAKDPPLERNKLIQKFTFETYIGIE